MKIAIVEDNSENRERLKSNLTTLLNQRSMQYTLDEFESALLFLEVDDENYDLIYLDIEMPGLSGMECAKMLRERGSRGLIVFVTNHVQYAIEGYQVEAIDFLLKPVNAFAFENHFNKIMKHFAKEMSTQTVTLKFKTQITTIKINEIVYLESRGHYVDYHTVNGLFTVMDSLKSCEAQLSEFPFFRCNNHYLVNLNFVQEINNDMVNVHGHHLRISRPRKKAFMNALTAHLGG